MDQRIIRATPELQGNLTAPTSVVLETQGWVTAVFHNVYTVAAATAKTFISGVPSEIEVQDITYTSVSQYAPYSNTLTIAYVDGGEAGAEVVTVAGVAISILIEDGVSTATQIKAAFDASGPATALASAAITGTGSNAQVAAAATAFAGGTGDVDIVNNRIYEQAHGWATGRKVALTTGGVLPAGLSATNYWLIADSVDTLKFATSLSNAQAGTAVDITDYGTGTHTNTPAALSSCTVKLQESNDGSTYSDIASMTTAISATGQSIYKPNVDARYVKIDFTIGDGQVAFASHLCVKGT